MGINADLVNAMLKDDARKCATLIMKGANPNCTVRESWSCMLDNTPCLSYAIRCERFNAARVLIENGADLFAENSDYHEDIGPYPLYEACAKQEAENILELMIDHGCDIQQCYHYRHKESYSGYSEDKDIRYTAMRAAVKANNNKAINILLDHGYYCSDEEIGMLIEEVEENYTIRAIQLVKQKKTIPIEYLIWAIQMSSIKITKFILSIQHELATCYEALDAAVAGDHVKIIRMLIKNGADGASIGWLRRKFQSKEVLAALDGK